MANTKLETKILDYPSKLVFQKKSFERIPIDIFNSSAEGSSNLAEIIADAIREKQQNSNHLVLGLATGSSPLKVYSELVRMHKNEGLSFKNVHTFNLDEYYPIKSDRIESYHHFMDEYLFKHIDIPRENIHIPSGNIALEDIKEHCKNYEEKIESLGGLDIQILGIGRTGHIGFNEPGSDERTVTRLVRIDNLTRQDATNDFGGLEYVPYDAITMGVKSILGAKKIFIMAWGQHKSQIVKAAVESAPSPQIPATYLQNHPDCRFLLDEAAAGKLTRVDTPWKAGSCAWDDDLACKAVVWLSNKVQKVILKLTDEDYNENGLNELILNQENAYNLNIKIFNRLQHTITGWPGGKPNTDDSQRPERAKPEKKRVLIFSPHPDDDVISMGGTFLRLVEQNHDVHVAYQTSGSNAVHEHDVVKYVEFYEEYSKSINNETELNELIQLRTLISKDQQKGNPINRKIKALIRRGEARSAARFCGLKDHQIHHLDLPFYEKGGIKNKTLSKEDIDITIEILKELKPHQVYAAGDLADPHGTHRVCLNAIIESLKKLKSEEWTNDCWLWLYRGAWQDFKIDDIDMVVPLSLTELMNKRSAIFKHQSQKDSPPYPGDDHREFWQRSEDRNRKTAKVYRDLGFAEYEAMEAFRRWYY